MRKTMLATALGLALALPASGEEFKYWTFGAWTAYQGTGGHGRRVCGVGTQSQHGAVLIKVVEGQPKAILHISKPTWVVPLGTKVAINIRIDGHSFAFLATGEGDDLFVDLEMGDVHSFLPAWENGKRMVVEFPGGNEPSWPIRLFGSKSASLVAGGCIKSLQRPTQPHGASAATQPFKPEI